MSVFFTRVTTFLALLLLMVVDILPLPIIGILGILALLFRPRWFKELVDKIYSDTHFQ
jgi:hypothetical protein